MLMQKASLLLSIKGSSWENPEEKRSKNLKNLWKEVNDVIEATPLLTLQQLPRLKLRVSKMSVPSKKETSTGKKEIGHSIWISELMSFVPISAKYHKWTIQNLHQKWKQTWTRWKQNTKLSTSKQDPPHSKQSNNVYMPLTIDSLNIKGDKNNTSKTKTL